MSGHCLAIIAMVGPPTYPAPMQQMRVGVLAILEVINLCSTIQLLSSDTQSGRRFLRGS